MSELLRPKDCISCGKQFDMMNRTPFIDVEVQYCSFSCEYAVVYHFKMVLAVVYLLLFLPHFFDPFIFRYMGFEIQSYIIALLLYPIVLVQSYLGWKKRKQIKLYQSNFRPINTTALNTD